MKSNHYRFFFDDNKYKTKEEVVEYFEKNLSDALQIHVAIREGKTAGYGFFKLPSHYNFILFDPKSYSRCGYFYIESDKKYIQLEDLFIESYG